MSAQSLSGVAKCFSSVMVRMDLMLRCRQIPEARIYRKTYYSIFRLIENLSIS
jgi:hypothetical protein